MSSIKRKIPESLAPYRFGSYIPIPMSYRDAKEQAAYKVGETVAVDWNGSLKFAVIDQVFVERDLRGDLRAYWRVRFYRADGSLAAPYKRQPHIYAGYIQRGYMMAGLAADPAHIEPPSSIQSSTGL
jgi:hypothetical protein